MLNKNRNIVYILSIGVLLAICAGIAYAAFTDKAKVLGASFSVGSADIKFYSQLNLPPEPSNLIDELAGPVLTNIGQTWSQDYPIKIYNTGTSTLSLGSHANYETANDPSELRQDISVAIHEWNDANYDGIVDPGEMDPTPIAKKTIIKWKTEGIGLGQINVGQFRSLVLRFSTENLSATKQGKTGLFDFEFESAQL